MINSTLELKFKIRLLTQTHLTYDPNT